MFSKRPAKLTPKEQQAVAKIYARIKTKCMAVAMKITGETALAEDAIHAGFLKVLENREKIFAMPCHKQDAYIVIIVRNKSIDLMRGLKYTDNICDAAGNELLASDLVLDVEQIHESNEQYKNLLAMVDSLPGTYREVFVLRYLHDFSNEEIAEALGIKKSTVAKQLERARNKMKQKIQEGGGDDGR
jgi:RNA polymerase sigma-70 factor (ECF subfamily)